MQGVVAPLLRKQDWAYQEVREMIFDGRLPVGETIDQEALASDLGISRVPLRQGLARLIAEGLVVDHPHRQWSVAKLDHAEMVDVYQGRAVLDELLVSSACDRATDADLRELAEILDRQHDILQEGNAAEYRAVDREFHLLLHHLSGLPRTAQAEETLSLLAERYIRAYQQDSARRQCSFEEHVGIWEAMKSGDSQLSGRRAKEHITGGMRELEGDVESFQE
jgi:DNA-binding GntR family transcriptional regulator